MHKLPPIRLQKILINNSTDTLHLLAKRIIIESAYLSTQELADHSESWNKIISSLRKTTTSGS